MLIVIAKFSLFFAGVSFFAFVGLLVSDARQAARAAAGDPTGPLPKMAAAVDAASIKAVAEVLAALQALGPKVLAFVATLAFLGISTFAAMQAEQTCPNGMTCTPDAKAAEAGTAGDEDAEKTAEEDAEAEETDGAATDASAAEAEAKRKADEEEAAEEAAGGAGAAGN